MKLTPFSPRQIVAGGEIARRMAVTADKILHHSNVEHNFARHYHERKATPEVPGGFTGYGMLLDAVVKAAAHGVCGDELLRFKQERIRDLLSTMTPDGNISTYDGAPGFWDNHDQAYLIQALVLDHRFFGEEPSLAAAIRIADFLIGRGSGVNLGLESAFLMLCQESGQERFLDYCRRVFRIASGHDVYDTLLPCNGVMHVYTWIARCLAQLQYIQLTGERSEELLAGTKELYRRVFGGYASISGSCSGGLHWGEIWDRSQIGLGRWGETCVSAYLMRHCAKMMEFDARTVYGDLYERIMYNAFWGAQSHDGLKQRYFIPFNEAGEWYDHETYCCPNNLRRMMFELPDAIFLKAPDGIAVNLFAPAELTCDQAVVRQRTSYPFDGDVELEVTSDELFTLYIRIPSWCGLATIEVGDEHYDAAYSGWFRTERQWKGTTIVKLHFEMPARLVAGTAAQRGRAAIMRGPLLYGMDPTEQPKYDLESVDSPNICAVNLGGASCDIAIIDTALPLQVQPGRITATCHIDFGRKQPFQVVFTPFASDHRRQTYFQVSDEAPLVPDELFGK